MIDWNSEKVEVMLNPRLPAKQRTKLESIAKHSEEFKDHFWLCTSGSTALKLVALSKEAILTSADAVNAHLNSTSIDIWLNPLPIFHVGGLGILARGYKSGAKVLSYSGEWNPNRFHQMLSDTSATLTSLVPTQVFDIVQAQLQAPKTLRAIVVGGGGLAPHLLQEARLLGWKLLPSYGATETASQIATASLDCSEENPPLQILPHMTLVITDEGRIEIKSQSLLTAYAYEVGEGWNIVDPKENGSFLTEDLGKIAGNTLQIIGRSCDFIKIGGESVHLQRLEHLLEKIKLKYQISGDLALVPVQEERLGHVIHLGAVNVAEPVLKSLIEEFQTQVMPFEKIRKVHLLEKIPRSHLGKLLKKELQAMIERLYSLDFH